MMARFTCEHPAIAVSRLYISFLFLMLFSGRSFADTVSREVDLGNRAFHKKDYRQAEDYYKKAFDQSSEDPRVNYDLGTALFRLGDYKESIDHLNRSILSDDQKLQADGHYNLGKAFYEAGLAKVPGDIKGGIKDMEQSQAHFKSACDLFPKDKEAAQNRDVVLKEIERLKKLLEQQQQEKKNDNKDQRDQQQSKNNQSQNNQLQQDQQQNKQQQDQQQKDQARTEQEHRHDRQKDSPQQEKEQQETQQQEAQGEKQTEKQGAKQGEKQDKASSGKTGDGRELSQDEANAILDNFDQNEQPRGLLNFNREPRQERPVLKDW